MLRDQKEQVVTELVERLKSSETLIVADYRGLTHAELDGVRTELLKSGARFSVVKNTLTRRAAGEAGVDALLEFLTGPTAIAFVYDGDMVAVAKTLDDTARSTRRLELKGGVLSGRPIGAEDVKSLASLPPAEVLQGQVLGAIVAPLTGLLGLVSAPLQGLVGLIDARIEQLGAPAAGTDADEAPAETGAAAVDEQTGDEIAPSEEVAPSDEVAADAVESADEEPAEGESAEASEPPESPGSDEDSPVGEASNDDAAVGEEPEREEET